jgi:hypothetical protein
VLRGGADLTDAAPEAVAAGVAPPLQTSRVFPLLSVFDHRSSTA